MKGDVGDPTTTVQHEIERDLITTQRIRTLGGPGGVVDRAEIAWRPIMIQHDLLVVDPADQLVYVFPRVVECERRAGRCCESQTRHHRLCAVMSGPDRYALLVEDRSDIVCVYAVHHEGDHGRLLWSRTDDADAWHGLERLRGISEQTMLMLLNPVPGQVAHVVDGCAQSNRTGDVRRARLKLGR